MVVGVFVLRGPNGGAKPLAEGVAPGDAVEAAVALSVAKGCRVRLTRDGITLAAAERGRLIDPGMADFPEARPDASRRRADVNGSKRPL